MRRRPTKMKIISCALLVALGVGCTGGDSAPAPSSALVTDGPPASLDVLDTEKPAATPSTEPGRARYCTTADRTIRYATEPEQLLDDMDSIDRSALDPSTAEQLEQVLRRSRSEFEDSIHPEGGWSWENEGLVDSVNEICGTELEVTSFVAQAEI